LTKTGGAQQPSGGFTLTTGYTRYVLGVLVLGYVINTMDRSVLNVLLESIKKEFTVTDAQLGMLSGIAFALFYAVMGIPLARLADRFNRVNVLSACIALWSIMTALCGAAVNFYTLLAARVGTAVGESGGSPPSHSLISDYFPLKDRATALSMYALAIPIGAALGSFCGGWLGEWFGWRMAFIIIGLPGVLVALLAKTTVREPPRGFSDQASQAVVNAAPPSVPDAIRYLWERKSFRHLSIAAGTHALVWYGGSSWNSPFFQRSHDMSLGEAGTWVASLQLIGIIGTFLGGYLSDKISTAKNDRRWYLWVPGIACVIMVPVQFVSYLTPNLYVAFASFSVLVTLASFFFGPSFAVTQAVATLRIRGIAISILLFMQTLIGMGIGPWFTGLISDYLNPSLGNESLRYAMVIVGLVNLWAAFHYYLGAKSLLADFKHTADIIHAAEQAASD